MKIELKLIITTFFLIIHVNAQEINLKNTLTNNASIGMSVGVMSYTLNNIDTERIISIHYTKHINYLVALQGGLIFGSIPDRNFGNDFNGLTANGIINLSNLSFGSSPKSIIYLSTGGKLLNTKNEGKELLTNFGVGHKSAINNQHQNIDFHLSASIEVNPINSQNNIYMILGAGINYRFNKKEESVEWNNPLNTVYQDLAILKTKVDIADKNELQPIITKIGIQDTQINSNTNDLKNIFKITKSSINEIERINKELDKLKGNDESLFIKSNIQDEITIGFHIVAGSFTSEVNAEKQLIKLQSEGFETSIIKKNLNGIFRVIIKSFKDKKEALSEMNKLKMSGKTVWLLE